MSERVTTEAAPVQVRHRDFDTFYAVCWAEVYRPLTVTLGDRELAREAVDEAMARAYARWRQVRDFGNQPGWVYRVALNWAVSQMRRTRREIRRAEQVDSPVSVTQPDLDLRNALADLDVKHRAVVVLRYLLDWSEEEVAEALAIPNGTVKSRLSRALTKLRKELS